MNDCEYQPGVEIEDVKPYPMTRDRKLIQIDCRVTSCRYYRKSGACANPAPAISLYPKLGDASIGNFTCWSFEVKNDG